MTALWTSAEAVAATGGRSDRDWSATGVSIDSRAIATGDLFVALKGPNNDGHDHVAAALDRGAVAAMVHNEAGPGDTPLLMVPDTLDGLNDLARAARARSHARIAAVTGSVGKTGLKEALRSVLGRQGHTHASAGNLNNHWGAPLSLARLPASARYGVFELGMNHAGEIAPLSRLVRPHVALITTIAPAHAAHFASVEAIADAKAEIFEGVDADGTAVLNRDNPYFARLRDAALRQGVGRIVTFGEAEDADVRLLGAQMDASGSRVEASLSGRRIAYRVGAPGRHWTLNSLAALACVDALGADVDAAANGLADIAAPAGRGQQSRVSLDDGAFTLIDESYNASPAAVRAALQVLALSEPGGAGGRRIAILGDMLELGEGSERLHAELADPVKEAGIATVFTAGHHMASLFRSLPRELRGAHAESTADLLPHLKDFVKPGDVVLVKGSLGMNMARVVRALAATRDAV